MSAKTTQPNPVLRDVKEMARLVIVHHFGSKPKRVIHQSSGRSNFVFLVIHRDGNFVVRINLSPEKLNDYLKEQWAIGRAHGAGIPTAEVLEVGNDVIAHPYMISQMVDGKEATYHPARLKIVREMGRYAAVINTLPTQGFGATFDWSKRRLSRHDNWTDFIHNELKLEARLAALESRQMLSASQCIRVRTTLEAVANMNPKPALNHGDLRLKNVIVDTKGVIKAILDWEKCTSNLKPHWELSLALHDLSMDEKEAFLEGYGLPEKQILEIAPVMKTLNIVNYAPVIEKLAAENDAAQLVHYRTRLSGALDLYCL